MHVEVEREPTAQLVEDLGRLVPQLSSRADAVDLAALARLLDQGCLTLFVAREGERVLGVLSLVVFAIPTGVRAWIEDVVVDESARGAGVGEALTRAALQTARELGAAEVDLTSRPSREAANALYQRVGFVRRDTNVYRYSLDG